ncbi:hypothetical protein U1Q18_041543 [Sarracenia purpurea var. burkii]
MVGIVGCTYRADKKWSREDHSNPHVRLRLEIPQHRSDGAYGLAEQESWQVFVGFIVRATVAQKVDDEGGATLGGGVDLDLLEAIPHRICGSGASRFWRSVCLRWCGVPPPVCRPSRWVVPLAVVATTKA